MNKCKPVITPLVAHLNLSIKSYLAFEGKIEKISHVLYSSAVGSLMCTMTCTRPKLAYAVSVLSHYMHNLAKDHSKAVKWIIRYVKSSPNRCLVFDKSKTAILDIAGFINSNYGGDLDRRRSISGNIFALCAGPITLRTPLQSIVTLSTTEA